MVAPTFVMPMSCKCNAVKSDKMTYICINNSLEVQYGKIQHSKHSFNNEQVHTVS